MSKFKAALIIGGMLLLTGVGLSVFRASSVPSRRSTTEPAASLSVNSTRSKSGQTGGENLSAASAVSSTIEAAAARLRMTLGAPQSKSSILWPDEEVIRQVKDFPSANEAFKILRAAAEHPEELNGGNADPNQCSLIRTRAIQSMQLLASQVPEVKPFLWNSFKSQDFQTKCDAFSALKQIGFQSDDLPALTDSLPSSSKSPALLRNIPQSIAKLLEKDSSARATVLPILESFLTSTEEQVRLSAACALAPLQVDQNPQVHEILNEAIKSAKVGRVLPAVESLAQAGSKAADFVPNILETAKKTKQDYLRADYLRAAAKIQPNLVQTEPEVAQIVQNDTQLHQLGAKIETETAGVDDLMSALNSPGMALVAAIQLGEKGADARKAVPNMLQALQGRDEAERDKIIEAINRIDPNTSIPRVDANTILHAVMEAEMTLGDRAYDYQDPATMIVMDGRKFSTWWTRDEVTNFASRLAKLDKKAYTAFANKVGENYPDLKEKLPSTQ